MGGIRQSITTEQLIALGKRFNVNPWQAALDTGPAHVA
jgi:rhamnulose-1-phosphate aldolase